MTTPGSTEQVPVGDCGDADLDVKEWEPWSSPIM